MFTIALMICAFGCGLCIGWLGRGFGRTVAEADAFDEAALAQHTKSTTEETFNG